MKKAVSILLLLSMLVGIMAFSVNASGNVSAVIEGEKFYGNVQVKYDTT